MELTNGYSVVITDMQESGDGLRIWYRVNNEKGRICFEDYLYDNYPRGVDAVVGWVLGKAEERLAHHEEFNKNYLGLIGKDLTKYNA